MSRRTTWRRYRQGVSQDYVEAHMWFNLAAAQSSDEDREPYVKNRDAVAARISDLAVVRYGQYKSARLDFRGSDARNPATEGDTLWVNYSTRRFSSRSMAF